MISSREIAHSMRGVLRLASGDPGGLEHFDDSAERFWRSFWAMALSAPIYFILALSGLTILKPQSAAKFIVIIAIAYVIKWVIWALIMVYVAQSIGREPRYFRYMMAYNWAQFLALIFIFLVAIMAAATGRAGAFVGFAGTAMVLLFLWYLARTALDIRGGLAVAIVGLDFATGWVIDRGSYFFGLR